GRGDGGEHECRLPRHLAERRPDCSYQVTSWGGGKSPRAWPGGFFRRPPVPKMWPHRPSRPRPGMATLAAEFVDVSKSYQAPFRPGRAVHALRGVRCDVAAAEVVALLGPNRAGTTAVPKILLGLCGASGGRVNRLGRPLGERSILARVGYMHENQAFPRYLTAVALLEYYGRLSWVPPAVLRTRVPALLSRVGLADRT